MLKIVECVPNFSEGRDPQKIKQITSVIEGVSGVQLLNVDPGADTNRTVVTFIGAPEKVVEAAFLAIQKASQVIDMTQHKGAHPRMGATDVCPFVPVEGVTMAECVELARKLGERVGRELGIPVYLYEEAQPQAYRKNLADIRKGEYEAFPQKIKDPLWKPDFGPAEFNARSGATVIGAREFLIAYNIDINTTDKKLADELAFEIREKGRAARRVAPGEVYYFKGEFLNYKEGAFPCGSCEFVAPNYETVVKHCLEAHQYDLNHLLKDNGLNPPNVVGQRVYKPGTFKNCKAIGWYVEDYKRAQISINLTNYKVTSLHHVFDEVETLARARGLRVSGSEIVGLVPFQALYESGIHYLKKQGKSAGIPVSDVLRTAIMSLGLNDAAPFEVEKKVLGLPKDEVLVKKTLRDFADEVSRETPAPGGGSIAALAGSLGASLASMVANLTQGKAGSEKIDSELCSIAEQAQKIKERLLHAIDADTNAFNAFMEARRLPQGTEAEKKIRAQRMLDGMKIAISVPWDTAELSFAAMKLADQVARIGNPNSITDAAVGAQMGFAGVRGGIWNVTINLKDISDPGYVAEMRERCTRMLADASAQLKVTQDFVDAKLVALMEKKS